MTVAVDVDRLQRELEAIVGPRRMSMRAVDLDTYARDMWPRVLLAYREGRIPTPRPHAVVWPKSVREVVAVVKLARSLGVPIGATVQSIQAMKEATAALVGPDAGREMGVYFDYLSSGLGN